MAITQDFLFWLQDTPVAHAISKTDHLVGAALQVAHILGFVLLLSSVLLLTLRLNGRVFAGHPLPTVYRGVNHLLWWGLLLAVLSGLLMFTASPVLYAGKPVFLLKVGLFVVALLVQVWLLHGPLRLHDAVSRAWVRRTLGLSLLLWLVVAAAGRAIGFVA